MVVASLLATVAFQAVISPPGSVWQENYLADSDGKAVMAYTFTEGYAWEIRDF